MLLPLIALLMSKKCFSDATSDSDANDVGNSGSFSWRIFFIRLYVLPTTESGHGHNFACLPIYLSLPICLLDPCVIFSILKPNQRLRSLVHPPTTEWKALYGELAPLKAITACDTKWFGFLASLLIITRGKVGLVFQNQTYIDQILQYLISSKIGWIRVFSAEEVSDDYDDDDNEICDVQWPLIMIIPCLLSLIIIVLKVDYDGPVMWRSSSSSMHHHHIILMNIIISFDFYLQCADLCDENPACASFEFKPSTSEGPGRRSAICR